MFIARFLIVVLAVALPTSAWAQAQPSIELRKLLTDAAFYEAPNGRPAEVACFMRKAQRLDTDQLPLIKKWYELAGMDNLRVVLTRAIVLWTLAKEEPKLAILKDSIDGVMSGLSKMEFALGLKSATRLAEGIKTARGENDLVYALALEIVGDLQALQGQHAQSMSVYARVLQIRENVRPGNEKPYSAADPRSAYTAQKNLRRIMSKLADTYWIVGQSGAAATLRKNPQSREGDVDRINDLEFVDALLQNKMALSPDHPSCVATLRN